MRIEQLMSHFITNTVFSHKWHDMHHNISTDCKLEPLCMLYVNR